MTALASCKRLPTVREFVMPTIATIIVVLLSVCSITAAARAESSTCKECRDQQQACAKNYSAKTCKTEYDICMKSCQKKIAGSVSRYRATAALRLEKGRAAPKDLLH